MRKAMLAMLALTAAGAATDSRFRLRRPPMIIPIAFRAGAGVFLATALISSYAECMASASGRGVYCNVNPRFAFGRSSGAAGPIAELLVLKPTRPRARA